jgi:hypothetical protein
VSCVPDANAAMMVAGTLTTTPTAAARPTHLCFMPDRLMTMLVMIPPPTPATPENRPMATLATSRTRPEGGRSHSGRNRLGKAKRAAYVRRCQLRRHHSDHDLWAREPQELDVSMAGTPMAANLKNVEVPLLLPGIRVNTSATNYHTIGQVQMMRWAGKSWDLFGDVMGADSI